MPADAVIWSGVAAHALALGVSVAWTAWSIRRHGWRKRSTRRYSYYLYILLHSVRLWWLAALARSHVGGTLDETELLSPATAALNRLALCLGHTAFSMIAFSWANVTGPRLLPLSARHVFVGLNAVNWLTQAALFAALCALAREGPSARLTLLVRLDAAAIVGFSALLACASAAFGLLLSSRFVQLAAAAADPTLGTYISVKFNKVNIAWHTFCACFVLRAVFLSASLPGIGPRDVGRWHYFWLGYYLPDVLPTLVALAVLRKRTLPLPCCGSLLSPPRAFDSSASELHQQLIFSPALAISAAGSDAESDRPTSSGAPGGKRGYPYSGSGTE
mmetsp:Transcript_10120/g.24374  ORF Transcript_10120/g.24374 Transcript_10120/m.24374 type:complete len:332 (-) Transcript_10120:375-1370(-)